MLVTTEMVVTVGREDGLWVAVVDGFSVSSRRGEKFGLRLVLDGKVVKLK